MSLILLSTQTFTFLSLKTWSHPYTKNTIHDHSFINSSPLATSLIIPSSSEASLTLCDYSEASVIIFVGFTNGLYPNCSYKSILSL